MGALAKEPGLLTGSSITPTFASAGLLKDRIKAGERPDLFLSADMASPRELAAEGRAIVPPIAFARNHMCLFANRTLGITPDNLATRLFAGKLKIRASAPIADPSGDYAVAIFDRLDKLHPGAGKTLRDQAQALRNSLKAQSACHARRAVPKQPDRRDDRLLQRKNHVCASIGGYQRDAFSILAGPRPHLWHGRFDEPARCIAARTLSAF